MAALRDATNASALGRRQANKLSAGPPAPPANVLRLKPMSTIPPVPDTGLIAATVQLEHSPRCVITIRPGVTIDREMVLREHGLPGEGEVEAPQIFERYRQRLVWQSVKRRWFSALTDFNVERLFTDWSPDHFVRYVQVRGVGGSHYSPPP
jgi:hypothetical protein